MAKQITNGMVVIGTNKILCDSITRDPGYEIESNKAGGFNTAQQHMGVKNTPSFQCSTKDVLGVLSVLDLPTTKISTKNTVVYMQCIDNEATINGNSSSYTMIKGQIAPVNLSSNAAGLATITFSIHPASTDGLASPITWSEENVTMPAYTKPTAYLGLGTAAINGTAISKLSSVTIDFNVGITRDWFGGGTFPQEVYSLSYDPVITLVSHDPKAVNTLIGETGKKLNGTSGLSVVFYQTSAEGVLTNTTGKTFTAKQGFAIAGAASATQGTSVGIPIEVQIAYDLTNPALELS